MWVLVTVNAQSNLKPLINFIYTTFHLPASIKRVLLPDQSSVVVISNCNVWNRFFLSLSDCASPLHPCVSCVAHNYTTLSPSLCLFSSRGKRTEAGGSSCVRLAWWTMVNNKWNLKKRSPRFQGQVLSRIWQYLSGLSRSRGLDSNKTLDWTFYLENAEAIITYSGGTWYTSSLFVWKLSSS